jgi:hypothetical protein
MSPSMFAISRELLRTGAVFAASLMLALPVRAQINDPRFADYFLVGRFGEVCTMCEVMVLCEAGATAPVYGAIPANGSFTLYYIQTRTFWSQVSTIWEWFISNFSSRPLVGGHSRPVVTYTINDGVWAPPATGNMHISLEPPLISMPDGHEIERVGRQWRRADPPAALGYCERLPLWDALSVIDRQSTGDKPQ